MAFGRINIKRGGRNSGGGVSEKREKGKRKRENGK
jgi:hypothetical protein